MVWPSSVLYDFEFGWKSCLPTWAVRGRQMQSRGLSVIPAEWQNRFVRARKTVARGQSVGRAGECRTTRTLETKCGS